MHRHIKIQIYNLIFILQVCALSGYMQILYLVEILRFFMWCKIVNTSLVKMATVEFARSAIHGLC